MDRANSLSAIFFTFVAVIMVTACAGNQDPKIDTFVTVLMCNHAPGNGFLVAGSLLNTRLVLNFKKCLRMFLLVLS